MLDSKRELKELKNGVSYSSTRDWGGGGGGGRQHATFSFINIKVHVILLCFYVGIISILIKY